MLLSTKAIKRSPPKTGCAKLTVSCSNVIGLTIVSATPKSSDLRLHSTRPIMKTLSHTVIALLAAALAGAQSLPPSPTASVGCEPHVSPSYEKIYTKLPVR